MCLCLVAFILSGIGVWQAVRIPDIKTVEITVPDLPSEFNNLKLVQISDLHASPLFRTSWVQAVVNKTNALNPDLILMTGDIIDGSTEKRTLDVVPLHNLKARLGVFGVVGNHEYYSSHSDWIKAFSNLGLHMLENEHVVITENGQSLVLAGLTDKVAANFGKPLPDIKTALSGAPKDATIILMVHQPKEAEINAMAGVDLQISGHTHGGQIFGLHLLAQYINDGYISGLYQINKMQLYISNGAGLWNGFPLRLGQPSEITQIILRTDQR